MKKLFCRIFGHKFNYYLLPDGKGHIRSCKRCNLTQDYKYILDGYYWSNLLQYNKKYAKNNFKEGEL